MLVILMGGVCEGLGISIAIPLLSLTESDVSQNRYAQAVFSVLRFMGLDPSLFSILLLLAFFFFLKAVFLVAQTVVLSKIFVDFYSRLTIGFCEQYSRLKYTFFIKNAAGYFNNLITKESDRAVSSLGNYIQVLVGIIYIVIYMVGAVIINAQLTAIIVVISMILFVSMGRLSGFLRGLSLRVSELNAEIQSLTIQKLNNFKYLRSTNAFTPILKQLYEKIAEICSVRYKSSVFSDIPKFIMEPVIIFILSVFIWYYVGILKKPISEILVLLLFFYRALFRLLKFQNMWQVFNTNIGGIHVIDEADRTFQREAEKSGKSSIGNLHNGVEFKNVNFYYGASQILYDINILIPKNKSIGIVGPSGAGKTTIFDLLVGLLVPQSGSLLVDGIDLRQLDLAGYRNLIGYVTQEPVIFNDTIANNISFWDNGDNNELCMERIRKAADLAFCTTFINGCENEFSSVVGDKGVRLSGGQRQRICIARELYKRPQIMIFDEATSALDSESEMYVQKSIENIMGKLTLVVIAHRLSTVKNCDIIYVIEDGKIKEQGSFDELYENRSVFYKMCQVQMI